MIKNLKGFYSMTNEFVSRYNKKQNELVDKDTNLKTMKLIHEIYK